MPQASLPSPRTWSALDLVSVPRLRADAVDAIAFLLARPTFVGQCTSGRSWNSGSDLPVSLDTEITDTWNGHVTQNSGSATPAQYWGPVPGWYLCRLNGAFSYTSSTQALFAAGLEGTSGGASFGPQRGPYTLCGSTHPPMPWCIDLVELSNSGAPGGPGDFVQFDLFQGTGGAVNLVNNATFLPNAMARWVCATSGTASLPVPPLTAVPSPITHAWLNANVRDTISQLIYPPILRAFYTSAGASLASTSFPAGSTVPLNAVTVDSYSGFNTSTFAYTAPLSGRYLVAGQFNLVSSSASTGYACGISINGGTTQWGDDVYKVSDTAGGGAGFCRRIRLTAGQTVKLIACQGSGSAISYSTSTLAPTRMIIIWEGI